ncbi:hypothetical protein KA005_02205 [bacterium]|nr:hypothetical protein [bacterium]
MFNLKHAFKVADRFSLAARILGKRISQSTDFIDPFVVNGAFSLEIYLKCLYFIETGKTLKNEHNLKNIYDKLTSDTRNRIKRHYGKLLSESKIKNHITKLMKNSYNTDIKWDLENILTQSAKAFIKWRYAFEGNPGAFPAYGELRSALRYSIIEMRPDLEYN